MLAACIAIACCPRECACSQLLTCPPARHHLHLRHSITLGPDTLVKCSAKQYASHTKRALTMKNSLRDLKKSRIEEGNTVTHLKAADPRTKQVTLFTKLQHSPSFKGVSKAEHERAFQYMLMKEYRVSFLKPVIHFFHHSTFTLSHPHTPTPSHSHTLSLSHTHTRTHTHARTQRKTNQMKVKLA